MKPPVYESVGDLAHWIKKKERKEKKVTISGKIPIKNFIASVESIAVKNDWNLIY